MLDPSMIKSVIKKIRMQRVQLVETKMCIHTKKLRLW